MSNLCKLKLITLHNTQAFFVEMWFIDCSCIVKCTLWLTCRLSDDIATTAELLGEHVKAFNLSYLPDSPHQSITVRRRYICSDVQRCFRKLYTNLQLPIKSVFVGEPAADQGGPRREFFRLSLAAATSDATLFSGETQCCLPIHNASAVVQKSFLHVGQWLSYSEAQDQLVWTMGI